MQNCHHSSFSTPQTSTLPFMKTSATQSFASILIREWSDHSHTGGEGDVDDRNCADQYLLLLSLHPLHLTGGGYPFSA